MLIAISGVAGSGKSTLAKLIQKNIDCNKYSFASPIKMFMYYLFLWEDEHLNGELKEVNVRTPFISATDILVAQNSTGLVIDSYQLILRLQEAFSPYAVESDNFDGYPATQYVISPRRAMQLFGTDVCRHIDEEVWIKFADSIYSKSKKPLLIDDLRFENETKWVADKGGTIIRIENRGGTASTHSSELLDLTGYDHVVYDNSEPMHKLVAFAKEICSNMIVTADKDAKSSSLPA